MLYALSIDWLSVHCHYCPPADHAAQVWEPCTDTRVDLFGRYPFRYRAAKYSTRQFSKLYFVSMPNPEGGFDDFAEVQCAPFSGILNKASVIVRFVNRVLYLPDFWELATRFLRENEFKFIGITRVDICADFNNFETIAPLSLIERFAAKELRHVGRGAGALYFNHGVKRKEYAVRYTGLSFGTHSSDAHVYLYDKSFELLTQNDKPYIRDLWQTIGLDVRNVWRLEVSIKSKGCTFKDKTSGQPVTIDLQTSADSYSLGMIYHTFVRKLFSFVHNRSGITNITREPRIELFKGEPAYDRGTIRNVSCGNRLDRIIIKALYQLGDIYRGAANIETADLAQSFAVNIAESTDLCEWMSNKLTEWEKPTHK